ncbi:hypothetical protein AGR1B_pa0266 [Agrobacterium fabacearum S56]|nr:hypothetical protein AGR1B_pa0266 [Agrobacterium fabacearum S56]
MLVDHLAVFIVDPEKIYWHGVTVRVGERLFSRSVSLNMVGFEKHDHLVCLVLCQRINRKVIDCSRTCRDRVDDGPKFIMNVFSFFEPAHDVISAK